MEYKKNQTENRAFQGNVAGSSKTAANRSERILLQKAGLFFHSSRNVLEVLSFYETIEIQLPEFRINSDMDEWHYLTHCCIIWIWPMEQKVHGEAHYFW